MNKLRREKERERWRRLRRGTRDYAGIDGLGKKKTLGRAMYGGIARRHVSIG